ncbi:MAG: lactonase family protein [Bacteroidetes bacterium]|nr:lactonase family protein [Bacteroidota bacterium]
MKKITVLLLLCTPFFLTAQKTYLLVGTYTEGKSEGIYVYSFNPATGEPKLVSTTKSPNPSFLAVSPNQKYVYAVNENADSTKYYVGGNISAFSFNHTNGTLTELNKQPSGGKHPCYVAVDKTGQWVFAGNYTSGSLGMLHAKKDGSLDTAVEIIQHDGAGPNKDRQMGPHVHSTVLSPDNKYLYVPDLGIDKVMIYIFDSKEGKLQFYDAASSKSGNGPRHFCFSPNNKYAYLMEEMGGTVVCYAVYDGHLVFQQRISALPADFKGAVGSADIHVAPNGKFLFCSNRGDANTISIFSINAKDGTLKLLGHQSTMGKTPRNFNFDPTGKFLLVANQNSDDIYIFRVNAQTGMLSYTGKKIDVPNPVCIKWITK